MDNLIKRGGGLQLELLWTNPNPTSHIGSTTIAIDNISKYKIIIVQSLITPEWGASPLITTIAIGESNNYTFYIEPSTSTKYRRSYKITSSGVSFSNGSENGNSSDGAMPPFKIFGLY